MKSMFRAFFYLYCGSSFLWSTTKHFVQFGECPIFLPGDFHYLCVGSKLRFSGYVLLLYVKNSV